MEGVGRREGGVRGGVWVLWSLDREVQGAWGSRAWGFKGLERPSVGNGDLVFRQYRGYGFDLEETILGVGKRLKVKCWPRLGVNGCSSWRRSK